jgi:hypothetical protein
MTEEHLEIRFGNKWKNFKEILKITAPQIVETFKGTSLEDRFSQWYESALPQNGESPINFLLRNFRNSYVATSPYQNAKLETSNFMAKVGWYTGKIPLLKRVIRINNISIELYLGKKTELYVSDEQEIKGEGYGNDLFTIKTSSFERSNSLNIEVGFTHLNNPEERRDWFYKINVHDSELIKPAKQAYEIIEETKLN